MLGTNLNTQKLQHEGSAAAAWASGFLGGQAAFQQLALGALPWRYHNGHSGMTGKSYAGRWCWHREAGPAQNGRGAGGA